MKNNLKKYILPGIIGLQFLFLLFNVAVSEISLLTGETIILQLEPIDPRSLMQGDYVILNYDISTLDADKHGRGLGKDRVKVVLQKNAQGVHVFKSFYRKDIRLAKEDVVLNGRITGNRVVYGIESYFVPEGTGLEVEKNANYAVVKIPLSGNAMVAGLINNLSEVK